jgi:cob(I)alamin adenosyltransferase
MEGYVQVYTGNGKGKTTAAMGQALRAAGAGWKVYIGQFVKGMHYSELDSLARYSDLIHIKQYGRDCFIHGNPAEEDCRLAREGLEEVREIVRSGEYGMVVLDEISIALLYKLVELKDVLSLIRERHPRVELILTGRKVPEEILEIADLVTEMREVKHFYQQGVQAREGIEK